MTKAGGSIQTFSESTHIEALIKACKMMKIKKKLNSFSSTAHADMLLIAAAMEDWPEYVVLAAKCTTEAELHDLAGCWSMNFWYWRNFDFRRMQSLGQTLLLGWRKIG